MCIRDRDEVAEYSAVKSFDIDQLKPYRRKLIMKIYVRVIDVSQGLNSTKVVFSRTHEQTDEAYVVLSEQGGLGNRNDAGLKQAGSMDMEAASGSQACPHCGTLLGDFYDPITKEKVKVVKGDMVQCESCKKVFEIE